MINFPEAEIFLELGIPEEWGGPVDHFRHNEYWILIYSIPDGYVTYYINLETKKHGIYELPEEVNNE